MNQFQYDCIVRVISNGAPAIAEELCGALAGLVSERNEFKRQLDEIEESKENAKEEA